MNDDQAAVMALVYALEDAWAAHDANAYGALFTPDATYTTDLGTHYRGRAEIVESHRALFTRALRGTRICDEILDIRFYGLDTAVLISRGETYTGERPERPGKVQTYTMVRGPDDAWRIAAFHTTRRRPLLEEIAFRLTPAARPSAGSSAPVARR
jgi:uncharacterized protein (TIGR02246 family)